MPRSRRVVAPALLATAALLIAGCSPALVPLSDPRAILAAAVAHLRAATTVHLDATIDGNLAVGSIVAAPGTGGGSLGLAGTHLAGDLDLAASQADVTFQVPALLGLTGELRQLGDDSFVTSSLTSRGWHHLGPAALPAGAARPLDWIDALEAWLSRPDLVPTRLDDAACRAGSCYVVKIVVGPADLATLASAAPQLAASVAGAAITLQLRIEQATLVLSEASIGLDLGDTGSVEVAAVFSAWDAAVTVTAPPADQVVEGPLVP